MVKRFRLASSKGKRFVPGRLFLPKRFGFKTANLKPGPGFVWVGQKGERFDSSSPVLAKRFPSAGF